jgi:hydrogenase expression/formation protein
MDLEEFVKRKIREGCLMPDMVAATADRIQEFKSIDRHHAEALAAAVIEEVRTTLGHCGDLFTFESAGVTMGEFGVGSRGTGDGFAHRQIARVVGSTAATVGVDQLDDAGAVTLHERAGTHPGEVRHVLCTVDGMHSRLSDYPFLAGFHATRATLRDLYVMGATPLMLFSDIHVADDGDVGKIFDYTAGITTVGEAMGVPLVSGSTLRIGGDMVLGERMTGCVGAVGVAGHLTPRRGMMPGDRILMTEGAGGGTIATTAIYSGHHAVVEQTINLRFLRTCQALLASDQLYKVHAMTDVTNGGLRGDVHEMATSAGALVMIKEDAVRGLVDPTVAGMLAKLGIDYLGVSLDALLITAPASAVPGIVAVIEGAGVKVCEVGWVEPGGPGAVLIREGREEPFSPRFREAPYTPVKRVVDTWKKDEKTMERAVTRAADAAIRKKERIVARLTRGT